MTHSLELDMIRYIHQFRGPVLDEFFKFLNYFDRPEFYLIIIPAVWFAAGWRIGLRLFYILLVNSLTNGILKSLFLSPRPFHLDPSVGLIPMSSYGFPSGAAQAVILLSGILLTTWKNAWTWAIACLYVVFISFTRVYLGVHFPTDILGGWVVGFIILGLYLYVQPSFERRLEKLNIFTLFFISQLVPLVILLWLHSPPVIHNCAAAMGVSIGLLLQYFYPVIQYPSKNMKEALVRATLGIAISFGGYLLISLLPLNLFFQYLLTGLWVSTASLLVTHKLNSFFGEGYNSQA